MLRKKHILIFVLGLFAFSCKKEWTCECTNASNTYTAGETVTARTKGKANKLCNDLESSETKCEAK